MPLYGIEHQASDIEVEIAIKFANPRRTGHVNLCHVIANNVDPREEHP